MKILNLLISGLLMSTVFSIGVYAADLAPPRAYESMEDAQINVRENDLGSAPGTDVSGLSVMDVNSETFALDSLWTEQPAMVIFYRGGWCPYCNAQVRELSQEYSRFEEVGVSLALISVDKPDASALLKTSYEIPFAVLSDQDLAAHEAFDVLLEIPAERAAMAKEKFGIDFTEWSGRDHLTIAVASSFVIGTDGKIVSATVVEDYTKRPTVDQLLDQIASSIL